MSKLLKDLSSKTLNSLILLLEDEGFKIEFKNSKRIEFSIGLRHFSIYSTNIDDAEFGLTTSFDIDTFLVNNFKEKPKHSTSLREYTEKKELSIEDGCEALNWEIIKCYSLKDFTYGSFMEDPVADSLYQVSIRNLSHIIVDDSVFQGELDSIISFLNISAKESFKQLDKLHVLEKIQSL